MKIWLFWVAAACCVALITLCMLAFRWTLSRNTTDFVRSRFLR